MVNQSGHDFTVDWWALGILIYEMVIGVTPFYNKSRQILKEKIQYLKVEWPDRKQHKIDCSIEMIDIVNKILIKDKNKRLGAGD